MKLTFVLSGGTSSDNADVVEARFVDRAPHKGMGLSIPLFSEDPQLAGTMTITWRLEPTSNGTLVRSIFPASTCPIHVPGSVLGHVRSSSIEPLQPFGLEDPADPHHARNLCSATLWPAPAS